MVLKKKKKKKISLPKWILCEATTGAENWPSKAGMSFFYIHGSPILALSGIALAVGNHVPYLRLNETSKTSLI